MSWFKVKTWSNRDDLRVNGRLTYTNGRCWTRRITWLADGDAVKLKLEDGDQYREVVTTSWQGHTIWARFTDGATIDDAVSILAKDVLPHQASKRATQG